MANEYLDASTLKSSLSLTGETFADADITSSLSAASRAIDEACNRRFWADPAGTNIRHYTPTSPYFVAIDDLITLTSMQLDSGLDGSFSTTLTLNGDFDLEPLNAATVVPAEPYTRVKMRPRSGQYFWQEPRYVKVTGKFGWPAVPAEIIEATSILASMLVKRKREAPFGIAAIGMEGVGVRIATTDPQVKMLIGSYMRLTV